MEKDAAKRIIKSAGSDTPVTIVFNDRSFRIAFCESLSLAEENLVIKSGKDTESYPLEQIKTIG